MNKLLPYLKQGIQLLRSIFFNFKTANLVMLTIIAINSRGISHTLVSPLASPLTSLTPLVVSQNNHEIFGFAPYWTFDKLENINFNTLTTLAYFDVPVLADGSLDRSGPGYQTFKSQKATQLFQKAHASGTKVVLTLTQMKNYPILAILDDPNAQNQVIAQAIGEVESRGIDGINVDFEYAGDPGPFYRNQFTNFVDQLTKQMHQRNPNSYVTVSVYAASVKDPKIYDIGALSRVSDGIFMMAYDFAPAAAAHAIPTSPLYGHKEGKYWYDVSSAVDDFLTQMPADKLILGLPWYGYNYPVDTPEVKTATLSYYGWLNAVTQTYEAILKNVTPNRDDIVDYKEGWDEAGQVGFRAYNNGNVWRMVFVEDSRSLGIKYDFAKSKNLGGVGIWALGFDHGHSDLWDLLQNKFGNKTAQAHLLGRRITGQDEGYQ